MMSEEKLAVSAVNTKKEIAVSMIISGIGSFILSFCVNYFLTGMPDSVMAHAMGNGISGLLSGALSVFLSFNVFFFTMRKKGLLRKE